jgi:hypothetical protein
VILVWVVDFLVAFNLSCNPSCIVSCVTFSLTICQLSITSYLSGLFSWSYIHKSCLFKLHGLLHMFIELIFFFWIRGNPTPQKAHFMGPGEQVKPRLFQALTRGARPDSNSRPDVQISSPLSSRYAPWGLIELILCACFFFYIWQ